MKKLYTLLFIAGLFLENKAQAHDWVTLNTGNTLNYGATRFIVKKNSIYIFNSNYSTLNRSFDEGKTWNTLSIPSDSLHHEYTDIAFVNDSLAYVVGYDGSLYNGRAIQSVVKKTLDRGTTWQTIKIGIPNHSILTHVNFFNNNYGIVFGTAKMKTFRYVTYDGGLSWSYISDVPNTDKEIDIAQINYSNFLGTDGIATGLSHYLHVAVSHDGGNSWATRHFHNSGNPTGLKFFDGANGIITLDDSIFVTHNAAMTISSKKKFPYSNFIKSFDMLDMQRGFFCTSNTIYYTEDAGDSWQLSYSNPSLQIVSLKIEGENVYASTCGNNIVLKLNISELVTGISQNRTYINALNIYPNPARDRIFVTLADNEKFLSVKIIDQLARIVKSEMFDNMNSIDVSGLRPGIYILEIVSELKTYKNKLVIADW